MSDPKPDLVAWCKANRDYLRSNGSHEGAKVASSQLGRPVTALEVAAAWTAVVDAEKENADAK
jgi:hypothetical protein